MIISVLVFVVLPCLSSCFSDVVTHTDLTTGLDEDEVFFLLLFVMMEKYSTHMGHVLPRNTKESHVVEITTPRLC